jgi:hypothetical protein
MNQGTGSGVIIMPNRLDLAFLPLLMESLNNHSPYKQMKNNNEVVNKAAETVTVETVTVEKVTFPQALLVAGITLVKATMKNQLKFALLWADTILASHDGQELIKACFVAAGYTARDARGTITNSSKFVAPALLFRSGEMTEKEFFALSTSEAAAAFKEAGGMKGEGLNPEAWQAAREEITARETVEKTSGEARPPSGEERPSLSAFQILSAAIALRKGELSESEKDQLVMLIRA